MTEVYNKKEETREESVWEKIAYLSYHIVNMAGKTMGKKRVRIKDFMPKFGKTKKVFIDPKKQQEQFLESIKKHKEKFWMKIGGGNIEEIKIFGDNTESPLAKRLRAKALKYGNLDPQASAMVAGLFDDKESQEK